MRCRYLLLLLAACDIYPSFKGEFNAGPVDPVNFPPAYLGTGGDRARPARGSFTETAAYIGGQRRGYYAFPFSPSSLSGTPTPDPLSLTIGGNPNPALPTPKAYRFFNPARCYTDGTYKPDPRLDDVLYDEQQNIITELPNATYSFTAQAKWTYQPVVKEIPMNANDLQCQSVKSEAALLETFGEQPESGRYFAWALIDPGAGVYRIGENRNNATGLGVQTFAWYNKFLVAYIDGGEIPTYEDTNAAGAPLLRMSTQRLFYPRSQVIPVPKMGAPTGTTGPNGNIGLGYDVMEFAREDEEQYTPVCQVFSYELDAPTLASELPKDAETIITNYESTLRAANPAYVFCLQVAQ